MLQHLPQWLEFLWGLIPWAAFGGFVTEYLRRFFKARALAWKAQTDAFDQERAMAEKPGGSFGPILTADAPERRGREEQLERERDAAQRALEVMRAELVEAQAAAALVPKLQETVAERSIEAIQVRAQCEAELRTYYEECQKALLETVAAERARAAEELSTALANAELALEAARAAAPDAARLPPAPRTPGSRPVIPPLPQRLKITEVNLALEDRATDRPPSSLDTDPTPRPPGLKMLPTTVRPRKP